MIAEAIVATIYIVVGITIARAVGLRGWITVPIGLMLSLAAITTGVFIQLTLRLPTTPQITITLLSLLTVIYWAHHLYQQRRHIDAKYVLKLALVPIGISITCLALYGIASPYTNLVHVDSVEYLSIGSLLQQNRLEEGVNLFQFQKRMLGVPSIHSIIGEFGRLYMVLLTPLIALSTLGMLAWVIARGAVSFKLNRNIVTTVTVLGVLLLVTNNRFIMQATYVNGHLLFGAQLLLLVSIGWLYVLQAGVSRRSALAVQTLLIPAMVFTRPEASILLTLALVPMVASKAFDKHYKAALLGIFGISVVLWQSMLTVAYLKAGQSLPLIGAKDQVDLSVWGLTVIGLAALLCIPLVYAKLFTKLQGYVPMLAEVSLWIALAGLAIIRPATLFDSLRASVENIMVMWGGWPWFAVAALVVGAALFTGYKHKVMLRLPVTTFLPAMFLLAYIRDASYRVGGGDSLNRMWIQILPLAVAFVVIALVSPSFSKTTPKKLRVKK